MTQIVDERIEALNLGNDLTTADRASIIETLGREGGDPEVLIEDAITGRTPAPAEVSRASGTAVTNSDVVDVVSDGPVPAGNTDGSAAPVEATGGAGQVEARFNSESTPAGEQTLIPGTETEQTGDAQRARAEMAARQQQSKMRRGDQTRVEDDADGLFAEPESDLFDDSDDTPAKRVSRGDVPFDRAMEFGGPASLPEASTNGGRARRASS